MSEKKDYLPLAQLPVLGAALRSSWNLHSWCSTRQHFSLSEQMGGKRGVSCNQPSTSIIGTVEEWKMAWIPEHWPKYKGYYRKVFQKPKCKDENKGFCPLAELRKTSSGIVPWSTQKRTRRIVLSNNRWKMSLPEQVTPLVSITVISANRHQLCTGTVPCTYTAESIWGMASSCIPENVEEKNSPSLLFSRAKQNLLG